MGATAHGEHHSHNRKLVDFPSRRRVELFTLLPNALVLSFHDEAKELVVTYGEAVIYLLSQEDVNPLASCSHDEVDTRIILHVAQAAHDHR